MPRKNRAAFRCKNCGHLESAEQAGMNLIPQACPVCGKGVELSREGGKSGQPENWEILIEVSRERLEELGLREEDVEKHEPKSFREDILLDVTRIKQNLEQLKQKQSNWEVNKSDCIEEYKKLAARVPELDRQIPVVSDVDKIRLIAERETVRHAMRQLEQQEFLPRDLALKVRLEGRLMEQEALLAGIQPQSGRSQSVFVTALDSSLAQDRGIHHK